MHLLQRCACSILLSVALPATSAATRFPAVQHYGPIVPTIGASERPDPALRYRVVFNITRADTSPDKANPSLESVARFLNLLAADGVRPQPGDVVAVVHGAATLSVLSDDAYSRHAGGMAIHNASLAWFEQLLSAGSPQRNPNLPLIARLRAAGVTVSVCSQALHAQSIRADEVAPGVRLDVSALTTLANLQLRGFALIPD
jgi:intracellular sulfur oxidation DsrE/DsrF family protein